jgi:hypothetical protein
VHSITRSQPNREIRAAGAIHANDVIAALGKKPLENTPTGPGVKNSTWRSNLKAIEDPG